MARSRTRTPADDPLLLGRVRKVLARRRGITEKRMFGGTCLLLHGNMVGGVHGDGTLMIRVGPDAYEDALAQPHARPMDFTGRPMRGFVHIDAKGIETDSGLTEWMERGLTYARSLPKKG